jgi:stage V sporulation protein AC
MDKTMSEEKLPREQEKRNAAYNIYVERVTPTHNLWANMAKAFLLGGIICTIGQLLINIGMDRFGLDQQDASTWCSLILVLASVILTGLNVYPSLANWGGAGALVPITGFANGVCASAIEYQKEGQVFGIGCQIFRIAGPVILYGIFSSWILGAFYWIGTCFGLW